MNTRTSDARPIHSVEHSRPELCRRVDNARTFLSRGPGRARHLLRSSAIDFRHTLQCFGYSLAEYRVRGLARVVILAYRCRPFLNLVFLFRFPWEPIQPIADPAVNPKLNRPIEK